MQQIEFDLFVIVFIMQTCLGYTRYIRTHLILPISHHIFIHGLLLILRRL